MKVPGWPGQAGPGQGLAAEAPGVGSHPRPSISLPADRRHTGDPWLPCHQRRGEWSGENAALGPPGAWTVPWKPGERREGDRLPLLMRVLVREGTGAGSSANQQLLALSLARQGGQLAGPLGSLWVPGEVFNLPPWATPRPL